jgi:glycopeptide antibiotics resistance protein
MTLPLRYPRLWVTLGWIFVMAAVIVCLLPGCSVALPTYNDKLMHALGYIALVLWFTGIYPRTRYLVIATLLFLMGVAVEFLQEWMHAGRQRDMNDVVANGAGIVIGIVLSLTVLGGWMQKVEAWITPRG